MEKLRKDLKHLLMKDLENRKEIKVIKERKDYISIVSNGGD